jgi:hypothetical protein
MQQEWCLGPNPSLGKCTYHREGLATLSRLPDGPAAHGDHRLSTGTWRTGQKPGKESNGITVVSRRRWDWRKAEEQGHHPGELREITSLDSLLLVVIPAVKELQPRALRHTFLQRREQQVEQVGSESRVG